MATQQRERYCSNCRKMKPYAGFMNDPPTCGDCQDDRADLPDIFVALLKAPGLIPRKTMRLLRSLATQVPNELAHPRAVS